MTPPPPSQSASAPTAFSSPLRNIMVPTITTATLAASGFGVLSSSLPFLLVSRRFVRWDGSDESTTRFIAKTAAFHLFYCGFLILACRALFLPLCGITGWHALSLYLPLLVIVTRDDWAEHQHGPAGALVIRFFFDTPLLLAGYVCREAFGARLFSPFCTVMDDAIAMGSMPFPSDIETLANEPYNVGLIINMCLEYGGATDEMAKHGVEQVRLPHLDTTAPSYESVVRGCEHIRHFRRDHPGKRVYIHCKGGIARASTMTLAHYVRNESRNASVAIAEMKKKRHVIMVGVKDYPAITRLEEERIERKKRARNISNSS